jgi:hypothetical protein
MVPLGFYSLNYRAQPLLLVDFRDRLRTRRQEMTQRSINEVTGGLIGISHLANWYYYVGADLYGFVAARHGHAMNQAERLDCYSQFRMSLALDRQLDPRLRKEIEQHSLSLNPLEASPVREMEASVTRYSVLTSDAERQDGWLAKQLDKERRAELAQIGKTGKSKFFASALHFTSFGLCTQRAPRQEGYLAKLDLYRRLEYELNFLDGLTKAGTPPEIIYESSRIRKSVAELTFLTPQVQSEEMRAHAARALTKIRELSQDSALQASCSSALESMRSVPSQAAVALGGSALPGMTLQEPLK